MPGRAILSDGAWEEYGKRKVLDGDQPDIFGSDVPWEINYLTDLIRKRYPDYAEITIRLAIRQCARALKHPQTRTEFVNCVMRRLLINQH